jgi:hypothetical protein
VVWAGEFGRSPDNGLRGGATTAGRDHNARAMSVWLAGGGVKGGVAHGATDALGFHAVKDRHYVTDIHRLPGRSSSMKSSTSHCIESFAPYPTDSSRIFLTN